MSCPRAGLDQVRSSTFTGWTGHRPRPAAGSRHDLLHLAGGLVERFLGLVAKDVAVAPDGRGKHVVDALVVDEELAELAEDLLVAETIHAPRLAPDVEAEPRPLRADGGGPHGDHLGPHAAEVEVVCVVEHVDREPARWAHVHLQRDELAVGLAPEVLEVEGPLADTEGGGGALARPLEGVRGLARDPLVDVRAAHRFEYSGGAGEGR